MKRMPVFFLTSTLALFVLVVAAHTLLAQSPQERRQNKPLVGVAPIKNSTAEPLSVHLLRLGLVQELNNSVTEAVELSGTSPDEIVADAKKKHCEFILYNDIFFAFRQDRGSRSGPGGRYPDVYDPAGNFLVRIRFKLVEPGVLKPRLEDTANSSNANPVTAQEAAEGALRSVRQFVVSELRAKK
ncbi:MAG: hypothetical protein HY234_10435 [Acidobacteria bacterium]|nr:hypothetical protein [Acidobacteriota bacterium]